MNIKIRKNVLDRDADENVLFEYVVVQRQTPIEVQADLEDITEEIEALDPSGRPDLPPAVKPRVARLKRRKLALEDILVQLNHKRECDIACDLQEIETF